MVIAHKLNPLCLLEGELKALYPPFPRWADPFEIYATEYQALERNYVSRKFEGNVFLEPIFLSSVCMLHRLLAAGQVRWQTT